MSELFNRVGPADKHGRGPQYTVTTNERGIVVCRPRYFADEKRADLDWERAERQRTGDFSFGVAQGEHWDVPSGTPYVPLFAERVREVTSWKFEGWYVQDCPAVLQNMLFIRGFDGGLHRPALVAGQYDRKNGVFWAQRELRPLSPNGQPIDMQASEWVALVRYMCGQVTIEGLEREERENKWSTAATLAWIEQERRTPFYGWEMPWIQPGSPVRFADVMAEHEVHQKNQLAPKRNLNSLWKVYRQQGLRLAVTNKGWEHRELSLSFLLREGPFEGRPRLLIDSSCKTLLKGMAGGLSAAPPGARKPYIEDRWLEDAFDAFMNAVCLADPLAHATRLMAAEGAQLRALKDAHRRGDGEPRGTRYDPQKIVGWDALKSSYNEER